MTKDELITRIDQILEETFKVLDSVYGNAKSDAPIVEPGSRIVFPNKRSGKIRVSEQELRFVFVEQLNKYCDAMSWDIRYSVETPTDKPYNFSKNLSGESPDGRSAMFDLTVYDIDLRPICRIEFKAHNRGQYGYAKDFLKLRTECSDECVGYFVQILENGNNGTLENISNKIPERGKDSCIQYRCHTLLREPFLDGKA